MKIAWLQFFIIIALFGAAESALAAPNIISQNLSGTGSFTPGSTITFSAQTTNSGTKMDTSNSHAIRGVSLRGGNGSQCCQAIARYGNYLYSASSLNFIEIYNVSNPAAPSLATTITTSYNNRVSDMTVGGNYLYVGGGFNPIDIYDITNPTSPYLISSITSTGAADMKVVGNRLYVANGSLTIFDVSNPASPTLLSTTNAYSFVSFDIQGNYAYLLGTDAFYIYDISNSASPIKVGELSLPGVKISGYNLYPNDSVTVSGSYVYIGTAGVDDDIKVINISNPANPTVAGTFSSGVEGGTGVAINGSQLYFGGNYGDGGVILDVTNLSNIRQVGHFGSTGLNPQPEEVILEDQWVFTAEGNNGRVSFLRPYIQTRFCIDNTNCATSVSGQLKLDSADSMGANASFNSSTNWTATLGTHTITYCSDIFSGSFSLDGVTESNENDNCTSYTFTVIAPPATPTGLTATPQSCGTGQINITWNTVSGASGYDLQINGGAWTSLGNVTSYSHTGLTAGSNNTYSIRAWNAAGAGTASGQVSATAPMACAPSAPTGLSATPQACSSNQLYLDWADTPTATSYSVYYSNGTFIGNAAGSNYMFTGTAGQNASFYVRANNSAGTQSVNSSVFSGTVPAVCPIPVNGSCGSSHNGSFTSAPTSNQCSLGSLTWTDQYPTDGQYNWNCVGTNGGTTDACLANVIAPPATPTGLTATPQSCGTGQINITWNTVSGASGYDLQINGGAWTSLGNVTSYSHTGLTAGSNNTYSIRAWNAAGAGTASGQVSATAPMACAPTATMSIVACTIPIGSSHCDMSMTWEIRDAANPNVFNSTLNVGYSLQAIGTNVSQAITNGTYTIEARNGSTVLQSTVITIACEGIGVWEPTLGQCVDPRPNLTQPEIRYDLSPGFNPATGVYDYIDITFQTRNDGRTNSGVNASYEMQFDRNGDGVYEAADSVTGTFGTLAPFGYTSPPITRRFNNVIFGNVNIRVAVDTTNTISEVNETDNVNTVPYTLPPPDPGLSISVDSSRVRNNESTVARWSVQATYPLSCRVFGPNLDVNPIPLPSGNRATQPIMAKSLYTIECIETTTNTTFTDSASVDTEGMIEER